MPLHPCHFSCRTFQSVWSGNIFSILEKHCFVIEVKPFFRAFPKRNHFLFVAERSWVYLREVWRVCRFCIWIVLVAQLVPRHSSLPDRLPVVVWFPAGPRVSLKNRRPAEKQRARTKKIVVFAFRFVRMYGWHIILCRGVWGVSVWYG